MRSKGYVRSYLNPQRTIGLVKDDITGDRIFFAARALAPGQQSLLPLRIGDKVTYEIGIDRAGKTFCKDIVVYEPFNEPEPIC